MNKREILAGLHILVIGEATQRWLAAGTDLLELSANSLRALTVSSVESDDIYRIIIFPVVSLSIMKMAQEFNTLHCGVRSECENMTIEANYFYRIIPPVTIFSHPQATDLSRD